MAISHGSSRHCHLIVIAWERQCGTGLAEAPSQPPPRSQVPAQPARSPPPALFLPGEEREPRKVGSCSKIYNLPKDIRPRTGIQLLAPNSVLFPLLQSKAAAMCGASAGSKWARGSSITGNVTGSTKMAISRTPLRGSIAGGGR